MAAAATGHTTVHAWAPGRVNLIGDHTDYAGGLALPMAIHLGTTITGSNTGSKVNLSSAEKAEPVELDPRHDDPTTVEPFWGRYVAGVIAELATAGQPANGFLGTITSTLPVGAGLSSSAALEVATALALGFEGSALALAELTQRAEQRASGVPCGIMDQLASTHGVEGHALMMDFTARSVSPIPMPDGLEVIVVHSGEQRALAGTAYAERRASCEAATEQIGPLTQATVGDLDRMGDATTRRRAHHVITENQRVCEFAAAMGTGDLDGLGRLMDESHASLRDDFEVSTPVLDALVSDLRRTEGVYGARLTGAGFGGCAVALSRPSAFSNQGDRLRWPGGRQSRGWIVRPSGGAHRT